MVRSIKASDGRELIQMRLDLGLLQMEVDGRPDGRRPEGRESWLHYYREQQQSHDAAHPDAASFVLDDEACDRLLREGIQYYHRYLSFWHLKRYELCARDTTRNLRLFQFVKEHARTERDRRRFDQWRPYVTMMHARAVAAPLAELGDFEAAIKAVDAGIRKIQRFLEEYQHAEHADRCEELGQLQRLRDELASHHAATAPADPAQKLRDALTDAIAREQFEEAARLRDEIRRLTGGWPLDPPGAIES